MRNPIKVWKERREAKRVRRARAIYNALLIKMHFDSAIGPDQW